MSRTPRSSPLIAAIREHDESQVRQCLAAGADIEEADVHGFKGLPLRTACFAGEQAIVKALLEHGANLNAQASDGPAAPLRAAIRAGHTGIIRLLIERGIDVPLGLSLPLGIDLPPDQMLPPDDAFVPTVNVRNTSEKSSQSDDNALDFAPNFAPATIEEVDILACRGVDTNILTIEFERSSAPVAADSEPRAKDNKSNR
ncbi:MAG: ankyrin repeat domain-containing protein [Dechloromonas sp.]|nr:ankyrin repeat domain-containing protein [Dechloromonas sp.]